MNYNNNGYRTFFRKKKKSLFEISLRFMRFQFVSIKPASEQYQDLGDSP